MIGWAALVRVAYLLDYRAHSVFWDAMLLDASVYDEWARSATTDWTVGSQVYALPPLYPYLLTALYTLCGPSHPLVCAIQAAMGGSPTSG